MAKYVDLTGLTKFKELQDAANAGKFWGRAETVNMAAQVGNISVVKRSTAYSTGDIRIAETLPPGLYLKCATAGTTAQDAPDFSSATAGNPITDGTVSWSVASIEAPSTVSNAEHANTADSATKLATARTINGVAFDGTANVALNVTALDATKLTGMVPDASINIQAVSDEEIQALFD